MHDYTQTMKEILAKYYEPTSLLENVLPVYQASTVQMLNWFRGIIPKHPIDEHDVFDVLKELGFQQVQKILTEKVCIVEANPKKGIKAEYDEVEIGRVLVWNLYEIF